MLTQKALDGILRGQCEPLMNGGFDWATMPRGATKGAAEAFFMRRAQ
jgi:hypothetical protein